MARTIAGLKDGKAPGGDGISAEVWKHGRRRQSVQQIVSTNHQCLGGGLCTTSMEGCQHCNRLQDMWSNYRGISLLFIAGGKIFARFLLNRLSTHITPEVVPETQCGNRSTVDMIFCLRQLQVKCIELHLSRTDHCAWYLSTSVRRSIYSWEDRTMAATEEVGMPREVHNYDRSSTYRNDGDCYGWRESLGRLCTNPTLFSIFLSAMLDEAFRDMGDRALTYPTSHTSERRPRLLGYWWESCYAQMTVHWLPTLLKRYRKKWMISPMRQRSLAWRLTSRRPRCCTHPTLQEPERRILVDGNKLNSVLEFSYLGSTISSNGCIDDEIQRGVAKASASFGRLRQRVWNNHHVSMRVKGRTYRAIVLSTLLYWAEAWTVYRWQVKKLHAFMMRHLRSIMRIIWMDKVTNKDILERTGLPSMEDFWLERISGGLDTSWGCLDRLD